MKNNINTSDGMVFELLLTSHCNLTCDYCYAKFLKKENMRFQDAATLLESNKISKLYFTGGEPLLQFQLMRKIVIYAKKNGLCDNFILRTNGTILDKKIIDFIRKNRISVEISLDGGQCAHDIHRRCGREGSFRLIEKNLRSLAKNDIKYSINYTVTPDTINSLSENIIVLISRHPKSRIDLGFVFTRFPIKPETAKKYLSEIKIFIDHYFSKKLYTQNDKIYPIELWFKSLLFNKIDKLKDLLSMKCSYHRLRMFPNGDIYPCVASYSLIPKKYRNKCYLGRPGKIRLNRWVFFTDGLDLSQWTKDTNMKGSNRICYLYADDPANRFHFEQNIVLEGLKHIRKHINRLEKNAAIN